MRNDIRTGRATGKLAPFWLLGALFGMVLAGSAQTAPPNDNLANATPLPAFSGTINGSNAFATNQTGEPVPVAGVVSGASIWYVWTAPRTNFMSFDTHGSTDPFGNSLDTVLAIYTLRAGTALTFPNLLKVTSDDDDTNTAGWPLVSKVTFQATAGTTYVIQVAGKVVSGVTNEGYIQLNWYSALFAGVFSFTTNDFVFGSEDNTLLTENGSIEPSLMNPGIVTNIGSTANSGEGRLTITRTGGYNGRVQVDVALTASLYTNTYTTNIWGTNEITATVDTNFPKPGFQILYTNGYTNVFITNQNTIFVLGYSALGIYTNITLSNYTVITGTNLITAVFGSTNLMTNTTLISTNYPMSNAPVSIGPSSGPSIIQTNFDATGTNAISYVIGLTNTFLLPQTSLTFTTSSGGDGADFESSDFQTITFDDYQMSQDAFINIINSGSLGSGGPDYPDSLGNRILAGIPRRVSLALSNPRLDPLESLDVSAPIIAPAILPAFTPAVVGSTSAAALSILDFGNPPVGNTNFNDTGIVNFERRTFRCNKPTLYSTNTVVTIYVYRIPANSTAAVISYQINDRGNAWSQASGVSGLEAGSDNAIGEDAADTFPLGNYDFTLPYVAPIPGAGTVTIPAFSEGPVGISITNNNNGAVEFDMEYEVTLTGVTPAPPSMPANILGQVTTANVTIQFDNNYLDVSNNLTHQQPGGAADRNWNPENQSRSFPPYNVLPGANYEVEAIAVQPDGKAIFGGQFTTYDSTNFNYLVRAQTNGLPDFTFGSGIGIIGPNDFVSAIAIDANNKILIGGNFTAYNGVTANHIARLNTDGSLDTSFNTGRGANGTVWAIALDPSGNVLIGGDFTSYNSTNRNHVARLLGSGSTAGFLDTTFDPGAGADNTVRAVAADSQTNVIIGGFFQYVNNTPLPGLARFTLTGALDTNFNPGTDVNGSVYALAVQPADNKIVFGGSFTTVNLTNLPGIGRLNFNGTVDNNFSPGAGANGPVYTVAIQPDQKILLGGLFTAVGGIRRVGYARMLTNGWMDTSFMDTSYNQFAGAINHYYNPAAVNPNDAPTAANFNSQNYINAIAYEPLSTNVLVGGSFARLGGGLKRDDINFRWNVANVIGVPTLGPQAPGNGSGNQPGNITFTQSTYTADDTVPSTFISVDRVNGSLGLVNIYLASNTPPVGPGAATSADFGLVTSGFAQYPNYAGTLTANRYGWRETEDEAGPNQSTVPGGADVALDLNILNNKLATENVTADLSLYVNDLDLTTLGGMNIPMYPGVGISASTLEIIDDHQPAGEFGFSATNYNVNESAGTITITVLRTNGGAGTVQVNYRTQNGFTNDPLVQTAVAGVDYASTSGTLTFPNNSFSQSFTVSITNHSTLQSNKFFNIILSSVTGGGSFDTNNPPILVTNTIVTIVDDHFQPGHLNFTSTSYSTTKGTTAMIGVQRTGGSLGIISVQAIATNNTASNGVDFTAVSTNLSWTNGDVAVKYLVVPTLEDNQVDGTKLVNLFLANAIVTNNGTGGPTNSLVLIPPTNAVLSIVDKLSDSYGQFILFPSNINILQNAGQVLVTVERTVGALGTVSFNYATANGSGLTLPLQPALAGTNYVATNGTLTFGPGVTSQTFTIPILYTPAETNAANRVITITLFNPSQPNVLNGNSVETGTITILDNQLVTGAPGSVDTTLGTGIGFNSVVNSIYMQPDGSVLAGGLFTFCNQIPLNQVARLAPNGSVDTSFLYLQAGSDGLVQTVLSQTPDAGLVNGKIMVGGTFQHFDNIPRNNIARLNLDGSLDTTFNAGAGADNTVYAIVETRLAAPITNQAPLRAYLVGGSFVNYNGVGVNGVCRLGTNGLLDPNFNTGGGVTSTNGAVHALAVQPADGKVIVGGDFTSFASAPYHHLVRLNVDGSVDTSFNADTGASVLGSVHAILVQPDGKIVIGGIFTTVNGVALNHVARLNQDGTLDTNFNVGVGANNTVETIALDSQGRILLGGEFTRASGVSRNGITRLNPDGTVDPTINFGAGCNGYVSSIAIQANDEINVGGAFSSFGGYTQSNFTRLFGGEVSGPGILNFSQPVFTVVENQTNAIITVQRFGGTGNANFPVVSALFSTADGTAINGVDYTGVTNILSFPIGETLTNILVPIIDNGVVGPNKSLTVNLSNPVGASLGFQSTSQLTIINDNAAVEFSALSYRQAENAPGGAAVIPIRLIGNAVNPVTVTVYTGTNGTAQPGVNYIATTNTIVFNPGETNYDFLVPVLNNVNQLTDQTVDLEMTNAIGGFIATPSSATLTIATVYAGPGVVAFGQPSYTVDEGAGSETITIIRTNGVKGPISVNFATMDGTAIAGVNYLPVNTVLNFSDGQSSQTVTVPIIQQTNASPDLTLSLVLSNPTNTTIGGSNVATLTIQDNIQNFTVASANYFISEAGGVVTISVLRNGPATGSAQIGYTTLSPTNAFGTNGFAIPGVNYGPTNGVLNFGPGQTFETIPIAIFQQTTVDQPETFQLVLTNASAGTQIGNPGAALITIIGDVTGFELATNAYIVGENGTNVVVTVNRLNVNTGAVSVNYGTSNGTAIAGVDYTATSGILNFADGQASTNVVIPINNPGVLENTKTFTFNLSHPVSSINSTNIYLLSPSNAVITITNTVIGISFSSATYSVSEKGVQAQITVIRSGLTNSTTSVQFTTSDGTGRAGTNYFTTNGTITFNPGQTVATFAVNIIDDHIITADHTVILTLMNTQDSGGNTVLLAPTSTATLTIQEADGSFIVAAGTQLVSESFLPTNGLIDPGETVTVKFGLRDVSGGNTTNLIATMQTNSNVTPGVANSQTYGSLLQGGHVVSEPFTFTANGTNNQIINVVFQLTDGPRNLATVAFSFILGTTTTTFSNPQAIFVPGTNYVLTNDAAGPADPYPSTINVAGIPGAVGKVTVTISNLTHTLPSDIEVVLVSPTTSVLLFNDIGGSSSFGVTNFTVTVDDAAPNYITTGRLANNVATNNKPSPYITQYVGGNNVTTFVGNNWAFVPPMPSPAPQNPYPTNLSVLAGTAANGVWSLYVADNQTGDFGVISNGWSLNLSTGSPVASYTDLELSVVPTPTAPTVSNSLVFTVALTNYGPASATSVVLTNILPSGLTYLSNNFGGTVGGSNGVLTFSTNALAIGAGYSFNIYTAPNVAGLITNSFVAVSGQLEASTNNATNLVLLVSTPSADLGISITGVTPNPVQAGNTLTLSFAATNSGPSFAAATTVTNFLPPGFLVVGSSASVGTVTSSGDATGGMEVWSLGNFPANTNATLTLTLKAVVSNGATNLDDVVISSAILDPFKLNNSDSAKILINPGPLLGIMQNGQGFLFTWPAADTNYVLQGATNLGPPIIWVNITSPAPTVVGQNFTVTVPTNSLHFFRLTMPQ